MFQNNNLYEDLFLSMESGVIFRNSLGEIISINPAGERILNLTAQELKEEDPKLKDFIFYDEGGKILKEEDLPGVLALNLNKIIQNKILKIKIPGKEKRVWINASATPHSNKKTRKPTHSITTFLDITRQKENEISPIEDLETITVNELSDIAYKNLLQAKSIAQIKKSESSLRKLGTAIRQSPVSIVITDIYGTIEYVNEKFCNITGYTKDELIGENPRILSSGELDKNVYSELWNTILDGREWHGLFQNKKKNGELYWEDATITPILNENGLVTNFVGTKEDITEKLKLSNDKEILLSAIGQTNDTVEILDLDGKITYVNDAFAKTTGFSKEEVIGRNPLDLFYDKKNQNDKIDSDLWKVVKSGSSWRGQFKNKTKSGSFIIEDVSISPVLSREGKVVSYVSVKRNITETIQLEEERDNIKEQLFQAQKIDSVGQLANGIAHDFNNILTGIMSAAQLLLNPVRNLDERSTKYANMILTSCERAADLTSRLLNFSARNKSTFAKLQIVPIIEETVELLKHTVNKSISITFNKFVDSGVIFGDFSAIQSSLLNIGINSGHAIKDSGKIEFQLNEEILDEEYCNLSKFNINPGLFCLVRINDSGSGIPDDHLDKIFDAFFTTKEDGMGTGLGLSSVFSVVEDHNGAIEVISEPGKGTSMKLFFPIYNK